MGLFSSSYMTSHLRLPYPSQGHKGGYEKYGDSKHGDGHDQYYSHGDGGASIGSDESQTSSVTGHYAPHYDEHHH